MKDFSSDLGELRRRLSEAAQYLNIETSRGLLVELEGEVSKLTVFMNKEKSRLDRLLKNRHNDFI